MTALMLLYTHITPQYKTQAHLYLFTDRRHRPLTDLHHADENLAADSDPDAGDQHDGNRRTASRSVQSHLVRCCLPGGFCVHIFDMLFQLLSVCLHSYYTVIKCKLIVTFVRLLIFNCTYGYIKCGHHITINKCNISITYKYFNQK